jgi:OTU-like cysteine protease
MLTQYYSLFLLLLHIHNSPASSLVTPTSSYSFNNFRFAPNGVCLQPFYFNERIPPTPTQQQQQFKHQSCIQRKFTMRNVPGDGDCMFQAVALAAATSSGLGANMALLRSIVKETRQIVASILESDGNLYITDSRFVSTKQLLGSASKAEGLSPESYLELLRKEGKDGGLYGGGLELTVLSNVLRRPISIYEMSDDDFTREGEYVCCNIICKGVFGSPLFEDPCRHIHDSAILSDLQPGAYSWHMHILVVNTDVDNKHACVLLPQETRC